MPRVDATAESEVIQVAPGIEITNRFTGKVTLIDAYIVVRVNTVGWKNAYPIDKKYVTGTDVVVGDKGTLTKTKDGFTWRKETL